MAPWDYRAHFYDCARKVFPINFIFKIEMQNLGILLRRIPKKNATVLDVASGTGATIPLLQTDWKIYRTDISLSMLKKAKRKHNAVAANCNQLPFKAGSFDIVTAVGLVEYIKNPLRLFKHLQNITTDGAKIIFTYAQFNLLNIARNFLGNRIYTHNPKNLEQIYTKTGFQKEAQTASLLQTQVLLKKV